MNVSPTSLKVHMDKSQMSLFEMSANVQKTANLKRCHDDFTSDDAVKP